jgi:hypothetical protein
MSLRGRGDEGWKLVKSATHCHRRQCGFLCGVPRVVWRCEDASLDATRDPPSSGADGRTVEFSGTGTVVGTVPLQQDVQYAVIQ